jgi:hypothetical protein
MDAVNEAFHDVYDDKRSDAATDVPVFVVLADELVVFHRGERRQRSFTPRVFHLIKSVAHAPLATYVPLHRIGDGALDASTQKLLLGLKTHFERAIASLSANGDTLLTVEMTSLLREVLEASRVFVERTLEAGETTARGIAAFAKRMGPLLLRLTEHATRVQLEALASCVDACLEPLTGPEKAVLQVVVTGDHQGRARSLGMQYFQHRLREPKGTEVRVAFAEGVTDERAALALVGTRRLDFAIAEDFFGDPKRLQRDVLGDAVAVQLASREPSPL